MEILRDKGQCNYFALCCEIKAEALAERLIFHAYLSVGRFGIDSLYSPSNDIENLTKLNY